MESQLAMCIDIARDQLESMAMLVERAFEQSVKSLIKNDSVLANNVIEGDKTINSFEIDIDNATYNAFALYSKDMPTAFLRRILSIQKINPILERIGDHAVNIAESADTLSRNTKKRSLFQIPEMAGHCKNILHDALTSFFEANLELAEDVLKRDEIVDSLNVAITESVKSAFLANDDSLSFESATDIIRVCKNLERIADLSSNIAEVVEFSIAGESVKHNRKKEKAFPSIDMIAGKSSEPFTAALNMHQ